MLAYLLSRAKEPSTYAGLAVILGMFGVQVAPAAWDSVVQIATAIAALIAVLAPDKAKAA